MTFDEIFGIPILAAETIGLGSPTESENSITFYTYNFRATRVFIKIELTHDPDLFSVEISSSDKTEVYHTNITNLYNLIEDLLGCPLFL